jgi:hypothetical protein
MTSSAVSLTCLLLLGPAPEPVPRLVLTLQKPSPGKLVVNVENMGPRRLVLAAQTYLVLMDAPGGDSPQEPRYWAELKMAGLPTLSAPLEMTGRQRVRLSLDFGSAVWAPDRSGIGAGLPLARAVRPGEYELQVQIVDERGALWRSSGLPVRVSRGGSLIF